VPPESFVEIPGLRVEVEEVIYQPNLDAPENRPHPFVYFLSIINGSMETVTIRGRKWVLRDEGGEMTVVEGNGVVGETPRLDPGQKFSYNSYHVIRSRSKVQGAFFGSSESGQAVKVLIPDFELIIPGA